MNTVDITKPLKDSGAKPSRRTLKLSSLWGNNAQRYKERALRVRIKNLRKRKSKSTGKLVILSEAYTTHHNDGRKKHPDQIRIHYQYIEQLDKNKPLYDSRCKVSCSCEDFLFMDEVALFKRINADVYFSNGELPVIKNPSMKPFLCKHLDKLVQTILIRGW